MPESKRKFLKAYEWTNFEQISTDQQKGLPRPELQKPIPPNAELIDLIPPDQFTLGSKAAIDIIRERISHRRFEGFA